MADKRQMGMEDKRQVSFFFHRLGASGFEPEFTNPLEVGQELGQFDTDPENTERRNSQRSDMALPASPEAEPPLELPTPMAIRAMSSQARCSETSPTDIHWLSTWSETRPEGW